jgi:hypothetical protein
MESIEADYQNLRGVLPKQEYQSIPASLLGDLVRTPSISFQISRAVLRASVTAVFILQSRSKP